jgi:hypothetical protein
MSSPCGRILAEDLRYRSSGKDSQTLKSQTTGRGPGQTGHPYFFTTICPGLRFSLCGPHGVSGLTAYLLNVKVFVWFNPSILVTGTRPLGKGVEPRVDLCAILVLTP